MCAAVLSLRRQTAHTCTSTINKLNKTCDKRPFFADRDRLIKHIEHSSGKKSATDVGVNDEAPKTKNLDVLRPILQ